MRGSGRAGSHHRHMFNLLRNCEPAFQCGCTFSILIGRCVRIPLAPRPCQPWVCSVFLIAGVLITVWCYHAVDFFCISLASKPTVTLISSHHSSPAWTILEPNWSLCLQFDLLKNLSSSFLLSPNISFQPPLWALPLLCPLQYCCLLQGFASSHLRDDCLVFLISVQLQLLMA